MPKSLSTPCQDKHLISGLGLANTQRNGLIQSDLVAVVKWAMIDLAALRAKRKIYVWRVGILGIWK